jgi:cytochrome o ubiquinol oxidase operon protein cyoD
MSRAKHKHQPGESTFKIYLTGFILCIILTLAAYFLVERHLLSGMTLVWTIVSLGTVQAIVQLIYFLHVGDEPHPRWNFLIFLFMALIVIVIVGGTMWIMYNLNYRMMG